jgi:hypothetical protein
MDIYANPQITIMSIPKFDITTGSASGIAVLVKNLEKIEIDRFIKPPRINPFESVV